MEASWTYSKWAERAAVRGRQIWLFHPGYTTHTHTHLHISDSRSPEGLCGCVNEACSGRSLFTWSSCLFWSCLHLTGSASGFVPVKLPLTRPWFLSAFSQLTFSPSFSSCHSAFSFHTLLSLACNFPQRYLMVFGWIWVLFLSGWNADVQPVRLFHTACANIPEWAIIFKTKWTIANVSSVHF